MDGVVYAANDTERIAYRRDTDRIASSQNQIKETGFSFTGQEVHAAYSRACLISLPTSLPFNLAPFFTGDFSV